MKREVNLKKTVLPKLKSNLKSGMPVAACYLILFYLIMVLADIKFTFLATVNAAAFSTYYKKNIGVLKIAGIAVSQVAISALAGLCTVHIAVRLVLNVVFPFVWVCLHSSPFDKQGYFVGAMTFVFVQLMRITPGEVGYMVIVSCCTSALTAAAIIIIVLIRRSRKPDYSVIRSGLLAVAARLENARGKPAEDDLFSVDERLYRLSYDGNYVVHPFRGMENAYCSFALLFQRAAYYFSDEALYKESAQVDELKLKLAAFLRKAEQQINLENNDALIAEASAMVKEADALKGRFGTFCRNFLRLFVIALGDLTKKKQPRRGNPLKSYASEFFNHIKLNTFGLRFAGRLSLVSFSCFLIMFLLDSEHCYWIPLNAFLLVRPSYEESVSRMRARMIGSIAGCLIAYGAYALFPNTIGLYIFFSVMIILTYSSSAGKWPQSLFATASGVSIASLSLGNTSAVEYRLLYLAIAVAIVFVANKFFFPSTRQREFRSNLRSLFNMQKVYITILQSALVRTTDLGVLRHNLINFQMLRTQIRDHIGDTSRTAAQTVAYKSLLFLLWRMAAEAEQMIMFVQSEHLTDVERARFAKYARGVLDILSDRAAAESYVAVPEVKDSPMLTDLAERYLANLRRIKTEFKELRRGKKGSKIKI